MASRIEIPITKLMQNCTLRHSDSSQALQASVLVSGSCLISGSPVNPDVAPGTFTNPPERQEREKKKKRKKERQSHGASYIPFERES
jgi:hypothetical protein